jgi:hypothetical protein
METLQEIMHKEMSRKEFLATVGFGLASIFGLSTALHFLFGKSHSSAQPANYGYGASVYGGHKESM